MKFNHYVKINDHFKKSINLNFDHGNSGFLKNYILSQSNEDNLKSVINFVENKQSAFTFTGSYGAGKSSFTLFLSELIAPSSFDTYSACLSKINNEELKQSSLFDYKNKREQITIVAMPVSPIELISEALGCDANNTSILATLKKRMMKNNGIILIIDELGKLLEKTTQNYLQDIYIFQQIAELANSSNGKFIFIGILHQSFSEYANTLTKTAQDEWYKIHGRFADLVINTSNEEKLDLISKSIVSNKKPTKTNKLLKCVVTTISKNKPINQKYYELLLKECWPLSPIVALLLAPLSLKNFGQNQRSIFSFLNSKEPNSFQQYLDEIDYGENQTYSTDMFWDYIKNNFEFVLSRSSDSHRWLLAQDSLDKLHAQATISKINVELSSSILKFVTLLDIFRGNTGLTASQELIYELFSLPKAQIDNAISQLKEFSILRDDYKNGFVLFDGSDFDIDNALNDALKQVTDIDYERLNNIASFQPIVAKQSYHETGTIRWMNILVMPFKLWKDNPTLLVDTFNNSMFGAWVILIPSSKIEHEEASNMLQTWTGFNKNNPIILGVTSRYKEINDYTRELLALEWIEKNTDSLMGDRFARNEIDNRKSHIGLSLNQIINDVKKDIEWSSGLNERIVQGQLSIAMLNKKCSELANTVFHSAPMLKTEMLNNNKPSSNGNGAVNALLRRMVLNRGDKSLGFVDGAYPPEWGLFNILLEKTEIYRSIHNSELYSFNEPLNNNQNLKTLWNETENFLTTKNKCSLKELYNFWSQPPFGIKKGLHSILFLSYLLSKEGNLAAYLQGMYLPEINELFIDYLIKESNDIEIKYIDMSNNRVEYIKKLHETLTSKLKQFKYINPNILDISKKLVAFINGLNPWVLRTKKLSKATTQFRDVLKTASDPNKLMFEDIIKIFNIQFDNVTIDSFKPIVDSLTELQNAYPNLINKLSKTLCTALQVNPLIDTDLELLKKRAEAVNHISGDFRIDALATRLQTLNIESDNDIAGIASLAANKPIHDWIDLDFSRSIMEIGSLCDGFKKAELYAHLSGKESNRKSFVILSSSNGTDVEQNMDFSLPENELKNVAQVKKKLSKYLSSIDNTNQEVIRIALIELGIELN